MGSTSSPAAPKRIVVVGGVAAGASAATKARRTCEFAEITVFERGEYVSFANCGLPFYLSGQIPDKDDLLVATPSLLSRRFRLDVRTRHEVTSVDAAARTVAVRDALGNTTAAAYDRLILATGSSPLIPRLAGVDGPRVRTLTTVPDAEALRQLVRGGDVRRVLIVGAGAIGLEAAEAMLRSGLEVTLVELMPQVLPALDPEMAAPVANHLHRAGVRLLLGERLAALHDPAPHVARMASGRTVPFDLAVLCLGVRPNLELARGAGLRIGEAGGVVVDDHMLTSDPHIYAAGDIVESTHIVTGRKVRMPLAGPANRQGRVAGANAAGGDLAFRGVLGTFIVRAGKVTAGKTGLSEREAAAEGLDCLVSHTHSPDHASYLPGSTMMSLKLVADRRSGRLLGAQVTGQRGVDKRLDVLAVAVSAGMKVSDLEQLDLAYAPPFSSAKDPAMMAGLVAANIARREVLSVTAAGLRARLSSEDGGGFLLLDVRTKAEHARGAIPGSVNIPVDELRARLQELEAQGPKGKPAVVYCRSGYRSYHAARTMTQRGWAQVANLAGGYLSWLADQDAAHWAQPRPGREEGEAQK
ncbi:MAG: FAD-dependent oxidoreductase [Bacillota bacterium]|nr:FAD-dependent oxidoreductase [Bacillota bacterium]